MDLALLPLALVVAFVTLDALARAPRRPDPREVTARGHDHVVMTVDLRKRW